MAEHDLKSIVLNALETGGATWISARDRVADATGSALEWVTGVGLPTYLGVEADPIVWTRTDAFRDATGYAMIAALLLIAVLLLRRRSGLRRGSESGLDLSADTRRPRIAGYLTVLAFVLFLGGWSVMAPLASAALAPGIVSPEGNRQTVEHLEGGIVKTIHVREGDVVMSGDPLITLEDVQARTQYNQLRDRLVHLLAAEARLLAERSDRDVFTVPTELLEMDAPSLKGAIAAQSELFQSRMSTQMSRERILNSRIDQLIQQNAGLGDVVMARTEQIELLEQEIESVQGLYEGGLERLPRLLALRRALAEARAQIALDRASIAENQQKIGETELQLLTMRENRTEEANNLLAEVERQLTELRSQIQLREDILLRTVIRAPISGTVMNIRPTTVSGIIASGEPLLEIVPDAATLVVDAKVRPNDIDRVQSGMQARVILSAYKQRNLPLIHGTLRSVSADRLLEERTGEPYYLAKIDVNKADLAGLGDVQMIPGMPAEVMLLDAEQTFLDYLVSPLAQSFDRSFRED